MLKIGLLGGTFNPVHNGHLAISKSFLESGYIDKLIILLTPFPPHKTDVEHASYGVRLNMLEAAFAQMENVSISTIENELPKPSYTVQTVKYFKNKFPEYTFYFCLGEDSLQKFHTWKYYTEILAEVKLLAAKRPGTRASNLKQVISRNTIYVEHQPLEVSSSQIRACIKNNCFSEIESPEPVIEVIRKEKLYV